MIDLSAAFPLLDLHALHSNARGDGGSDVFDELRHNAA